MIKHLVPLADACVRHVGCHHFTTGQGTEIVILIVGAVVVTLIGTWFRSRK